jgi:hypothetical protein
MAGLDRVKAKANFSSPLSVSWVFLGGEGDWEQDPIKFIRLSQEKTNINNLQE